MRIALVTETFPPEVNGVAMTLERLVRGLASRGHDIQIVRPRQSKTDSGSTQPHLSQVVVPGVPLPRYKGLHMGLPCRGKLASLWRAATPDVVHVATEGPLGFSALRAASGLGIPVTSSFHTNFHQYGKHYGYGFLYKGVTTYLRWFHNQTGCTMVPSDDAREQLTRDGFRNVAVIARGVDATLFNPARRSEELRRIWGVTPEDPVVIYVGRIAPEKNIPLVMRAFEAMAKVEPRAKLVLVGDGPALPALRKSPPGPGVIFAGMQRGELLATHYASADAFLFASTTETFGNVVTEAMACGLAVLTYDYAAGRQHIRTGVNGVLVPFNDSQTFVDTAAELMRMRDRWPTMRDAAATTARALTWESIVGQFEDTLLATARHAKPLPATA